MGVIDGTFTMTGGTISENEAASDGGGVDVLGTFNVSGTPVIKGNTLSDGTTANNVSLTADTTLHLVDELTSGEIWITKVSSSNPLPGNKFGETTPLGSSAGYFVADGTTPLVGSISGTDLIWVAAGTWSGEVFIPNPAGYTTANGIAAALNNGDHSGTAEYDASTNTVTLLKDVELGGTPLKLSGENEESPVILNLGGMTLSRNNDSGNFSVITVESGKYLTLNDSSEDKSGKITGGKAAQGGGVFVDAGATFTMNGGTITKNAAIFETYGGIGGVCVLALATFTMTGGTITENSAENGGGVYVFSEANLKVKGSPYITGNTLTDGSVNNVELEDSVDKDENDGLFLIGDFDGEIRITLIEDEEPEKGEPFGIVNSNPSGAANFKADGDSGLYGYISNGKLIWGPVERKSSSQSQGTSVWLTAEPTVASTPTPTPAVTPTPDVPQVKPVTPTGTPAKTLVPFLGVLAGLGAAGVVFGLRRK